jgi:type I restriction enzyme M protein
MSEQGGDGSDLDFHGQDNDAGVVSIAKMNLILHNLASAHIEFGDVLEDPQNIRDGQLMAFDRVLANPPFAQNWNLSRCQRTERFQYGYAPQTGKKADLMFLQHMLASLKPTGRGAVVMPHGVLFRGRKEKDIRKNLLKRRLSVTELTPLELSTFKQPEEAEAKASLLKKHDESSIPADACACSGDLFSD